MTQVTQDYGDYDDDDFVGKKDVPNFKASDAKPEPEPLEDDVLDAGESEPMFNIINLNDPEPDHSAEKLQQDSAIVDGEYVSLDDATIIDLSDTDVVDAGFSAVEENNDYASRQAIEDELFASILNRASFTTSLPLQQKNQSRRALQQESQQPNDPFSALAAAAAGVVSGVVGGIKTGLVGKGDRVPAPSASDYMQAAFDDSVKDFQAYEQQMWNLRSMDSVNQKIKDIAAKTGVSVDDVRSQLKTNPELKPLLSEINNTVKKDKLAERLFKGMNAAQDEWLGVFSKAKRKEIELEDGHEKDSLSKQLMDNAKRMMETVRQSPFDNPDGESQFKKFADKFNNVMTSIKQFITALAQKLKGGNDNAPSP